MRVKTNEFGKLDFETLELLYYPRVWSQSHGAESSKTKF